MNKRLRHPLFPVAMSTVFLALFIAFLFLSGCNTRFGSDETKGITETSGQTESEDETITTDTSETTTEAEITPREKLLYLIQRENKSITGDFTVADKWIWLYADLLFNADRAPVSADFLYGASLEQISEKYTASAGKYNVAFDDGEPVVIWVIEAVENQNRYLVDLVFDSSAPTINRSYVFEALKRDSRFSDSLHDSLDNKYDHGIGEYNITQITGRDPDVWYFNMHLTELDSEGIAKFYFQNKDRTKTVCVTADLTDRKILSEEEIKDFEKPSSSSTALPVEVGGGKYILDQDQDCDLYITDKNTGERILIYDSYVGDDYEIDKINVARFFDVYDDRLVIYSVGLYEGTAGFGIYNIETKENRFFSNDFYPVFLSGDMLYIGNKGIFSLGQGFLRIDLTGDLDEHYDMLAPSGIDLRTQDVELILSPDGKHLIFLYTPDYKSNPLHRVLMVCDSIDGRVIDTFDIIANGCSPQYLKFTDDNILLILCERHAMCDDFMFTFDLRLLDKK
jgi:hypothetical protein